MHGLLSAVNLIIFATFLHPFVCKWKNHVFSYLITIVGDSAKEFSKSPEINIHVCVHLAFVKGIRLLSEKGSLSTG